MRRRITQSPGSGSYGAAWVLIFSPDSQRSLDTYLAAGRKHGAMAGPKAALLEYLRYLCPARWQDFEFSFGSGGHEGE